MNLLNLFKQPSTSFYLIRFIFIRLMAIVYGFAFLSLNKQVLGLFGSNGILPTQQFITNLNQHITPFIFPNLFWIDQSDQFLTAGTYLGMTFSLLLFLNFAPKVCSILLWLLYLSYVNIGQVFMGYQWDALLLESGFILIFFAPKHFYIRSYLQESPPSRLYIFLFRFTLFKLMFLSAYVKLNSGDESWTNLTALQYHFWTQPLPNPLSWHIHQFNSFILKSFTLFTLIIELVFPFFMFFNRKLRWVCFIGFQLLQLTIISSGNFGFFNVLTMALTFLILDDQAISSKEHREQKINFNLKCWIHSVIFILLLSLSISKTLPTFRIDLHKSIQHIHQSIAHWHISSSYGLFAVMTKSRPEIMIEGSYDGKVWKEYQYYYKPDKLDKNLSIAYLHMPRLDWQLWFAALRGHYQRSPWFLNFSEKLLRNSPDVRKLLISPFDEDKPPANRHVLCPPLSDFVTPLRQIL